MSFADFFQHILQITEYHGADLFTSNKRYNQLQSVEELKPFLRWFTESITENNCISVSELEIYKQVWMKEDLVPNEELDSLIDSYFIEKPSPLNSVNYDFLIDSANKELLALESFEKFLKKEVAKTENEKDSNNELDLYISKEINDLEKINAQLNDDLVGFAEIWSQLRAPIYNSQKEDNLRICQEINSVNSQIDHHLNNISQNYFNQSPVEGLPEEYYCVFQMLCKTRIALIEHTIQIEMISLFITQLNNLEDHLVADACSGDISEQLQMKFFQLHLKMPDLTEIRNSAVNCVSKEMCCINSLKHEHLQKSRIFLSNRLQVLKEIKSVLRMKKILNCVIAYVIKQNKLIFNARYDILKKTSMMITAYIEAFERRMNDMSTYQPTRQKTIDQHFQNMITTFLVKDRNLEELDQALVTLDANISRTHVTLHEDVASFEQQVLDWLENSREKMKRMFDGPTREAFHNMLEVISAELSSYKTIVNRHTSRMNKYTNIVSGASFKEQYSKGSTWLKFLENPHNIISELEILEKDLNILKKDNFNLLCNMDEKEE